MNVADIKSEAALRLYLHLLLAENVGPLPYKQVSELAGIRTPSSYTHAKEELAALGLISHARSGRETVIRLIAQILHKPVEFVPEPVIPDLAQIDDPKLKKAEQFTFLRAAYNKLFPSHAKKQPISDSSIKLWLKAEPDVEAVYDMLAQTSTRSDIQSPPTYILRALEKQKAAPSPEVRSKGFVKPGCDFATEEEAQAYYKAHPDPLASKIRHLKIVLPAQPWQIRGGENVG